MIVFLGLPKTGSTWIYRNLKFNKFLNIPNVKENVKEPHVFNNQCYFTEQDVKRTVDFTTQNWSMDSGLARQLDKYVDKYLYIVRNPLDLVKSWHNWTIEGQNFEDTQMLTTRSGLCSIGSVLERWYHLAGKDKIVVDLYENLKQNQEEFFKKICKELSIPFDKIHKPQYINKTDRVLQKPVYTKQFLHYAIEETEKFEDLTGINTGYLDTIHKEME